MAIERRRARPLLVLLAAAVILGLAACWAVWLVATRIEEPSAPLLPALPVAKGTVVIAVPTAPRQPVDLVVRRRMLEERGYTVQARPVASPAEAAGLLASGDVDLAALPPEQAALLFEQGRDVLLLAPCLAGSGALVAPVASPIASTADLRGKRLLASVHGLETYRLRATLAGRGIELDRDLVLVPLLDPGDVRQVFAGGDADLALVPSPHDAELIASGAVRVIEGLAAGWEAVYPGPGAGVACTWVASLTSARRLGWLRSDLMDAQRQLLELVASDERFAAAMAELDIDPNQAFVARQLLPQAPARLGAAERQGVLRRLQLLLQAGYLRNPLWLDPRAAAPFLGGG